MISSLTIQAQPVEKKGQGGKIKERIKAQRVAFISDRLALTSDEAQKFWPVYNQFTADFEEVKKAQNEQRKNTNDKLAVLGDKEIEKALEDELSSQQKLIELQRKYQIELKKVISVRKVAMLYKAERDFKLQLLKRMSEAGQKMPPEGEEFN
jgi:uncharacterized small protein (DUF1192 family)